MLFLSTSVCAATSFFHIIPAASCSRTCRPQWNALRTCSLGHMQEGMVPVLRPVPRQASSTQTPCCLGRCCSPSALPTSSKTSCASKIHCQPFYLFVYFLFISFLIVTTKFLFYCNRTAVLKKIQMDALLKMFFFFVVVVLQTLAQTA